MNIINREQFLKPRKVNVKEVDLGEEGITYVREMSGHERDQFERSLLKEKRDAQGKVIGYEQNLSDFRSKLAIATLCDENGKLLLNPDDLVIFSKNISASTLAKIVQVATELNGIGEEQKEEITKNSEVGQADNSSSDSVES